MIKTLGRNTTTFGKFLAYPKVRLEFNLEEFLRHFISSNFI